MNDLDIREHIEAIIRKRFPIFVKPLDDAMTSRDVPGWDSVSHFALVMQIEEELQIELNAAKSYKLKNIGDLMVFVIDGVRAQAR